MVEDSITSRPVIEVICQRGVGDCGIAALAMYLGLPYEDVLCAATTSTKDHRLHHNGMYSSHVIRVAKFLGITIHRRKRWDEEESCGILALDHKDGKDGHLVVLKRGLIFDPSDGCCWEPQSYFANTRFTIKELLTQD